MANLRPDNLSIINQHFSDSARVKQETAEACSKSIIKASKLISATFKSGGKLLICGNGGSAADCQHMAGEFVCLLNKSFKRPALPAISLTTDSSIMTAFANDFSFDQIFARQVEALGKKGDLLVGISTSGNSQNIIQAIKVAKLKKLKTIVLTGQVGKLTKMEIDATIAVPSRDTQYIQETHLATEHVLCFLVEQELYGH